MQHTIQTYSLPYSYRGMTLPPPVTTHGVSTEDARRIIDQLGEPTALSQYDQQYCVNNNETQIQLLVVIKPPVPA